MFPVPKPDANKWRLIIDLRKQNLYCEEMPVPYKPSSTFATWLGAATG